MELTIEEILSIVDLVDYVSQYTDVEERNGEYWALSPLTSEVTPSFHIDSDRTTFYDFSSGKSGNVISFIQAHDHCSIGTAIDIAREYANGQTTGDHPCLQRIVACRVARKFAQKKTEKVCTAKPLPDNYMDMYEIAGSRADIWRNEGITDESMERFQVRYDGIQNRLVFPIRDIDGKIINVSGRTLDPDFKKKNLRKYTYYQKFGALTTIYAFSDNHDSYLEQGEIILFEGAKSVMIADSMGVRNTGAILTSHLNRAQVKILIKLGCRVVFALDKDVDIKEDSQIRLLKHYVPVEYICDTGGLLDRKMSPVDAGPVTWKVLYQRRWRL